MTRLAILGSTGSIGINTLDVVSFLKGKFEITALSTNSNIELLARQANSFAPQIISVTSPSSKEKLKRLVRSKNIKMVCGEEGLCEIVSRSDVDAVVFAISGQAALKPLLKAIEHRKRIALANKESLVSAGEIIVRNSRSRGVQIVPIDSEHSAIFQCLESRPRGSLKKIYLTSSGGPLLNVRKSRFKGISRDFVLRHPKWKMGKKITVDSATLMNKGLEIIEARWLFDIDESYIDVVIHPEAIVHSLVELVDGTVLAQLANPDMRLPIQFALTYPERFPSPVARLDLVKAKRLTFERPDTKKFPCLRLAREALGMGGTSPAVLVAADEVAVASFLKNKVPFHKIPDIIEGVLARHRNVRTKTITITDVLEADAWARQEAEKACYR
jgi:1-deoxy-D-xylulose-5-phosphate reductoisomerase